MGRLPHIVVVDGMMLLVFSPLIAEADREVDVELSRNGNRIAVADACGVGEIVGLVAVVVASALDVVAEYGEVGAYVMTRECVARRASADEPAQLYIAAVDAPIAVGMRIASPCMHPIDAQGITLPYAKQHAKVGDQCRVIQHIGRQCQRY